MKIYTRVIELIEPLNQSIEKHFKITFKNDYGFDVLVRYSSDIRHDINKTYSFEEIIKIYPI